MQGVTIAVVAVIVIVIFIFGFSFIWSRVNPSPPSRVITSTNLPTPTPSGSNQIGSEQTPRPNVVVITPSPTPIPSGPTPVAPQGAAPIILTPTPTPSPFLVTPTPIQSRPTPIPLSPTVIIPPVKVYQGPGFFLAYPSNWGLLTCRNSLNFEFDPFNNLDTPQVLCNFAQKPITVITQGNLLNCPGDTILINNISVRRSVVTAGNVIGYKWCTLTQPVLEITHRVSSDPIPATSPVDYSMDIELVISSLQFTTPLQRRSLEGIPPSYINPIYP